MAEYQNWSLYFKNVNNCNSHTSCIIIYLQVQNGWGFERLLVVLSHGPKTCRFGWLESLSGIFLPFQWLHSLQHLPWVITNINGWLLIRGPAHSPTNQLGKVSDYKLYNWKVFFCWYLKYKQTWIKPWIKKKSASFKLLAYMEEYVERRRMLNVCWRN